MASWIRKLLIAGYLVLIAFLVVSGLAPYISPQSIELISVIGMGFPYLMLLNFVFIIYWSFKKRWPFWVGIALTFTFSPTIFNFIQFNSTDALDETSVKAISFNVRSFNKYGWKPNTDAKSEVVKFMLEEQPDIICFQEFYNLPNSKKYNTADEIMNQTGCKNFFMENYFYRHKQLGKRYFGLAVFSKHKIINGNVVYQLKGEKKARAIYVDLEINNDTVRVYNLHLRSIRFKKEDYQFLNDVTEVSHEEKISKSRTIVQKLERAFSLRALEAEGIKRHLDQCPYPYLLMGDFNEIPNTYAYKTISEGLKDGFIEKGTGFGLSYEGKGMLLSQRIDYILSSPEIDFQSFRTHQNLNISDHKPLSANIKLNL